MTDWHAVPCHIAGIGSGIVLLEDNFFKLSERAAGMRMNDFIHITLAWKCAPNHMYAK